MGDAPEVGHTCDGTEPPASVAHASTAEGACSRPPRTAAWARASAEPDRAHKPVTLTAPPLVGPKRILPARHEGRRGAPKNLGVPRASTAWASGREASKERPVVPADEPAPARAESAKPRPALDPMGRRLRGSPIGRHQSVVSLSSSASTSASSEPSDDPSAPPRGPSCSNRSGRRTTTPSGSGPASPSNASSGMASGMGA